MIYVSYLLNSANTFEVFLKIYKKINIMALTENQFEEAVVSIVKACQENEQFKTEILEAINGDAENMTLSDEQLDSVSGGLWRPTFPWIKPWWYTFIKR